MAASDSLPPDQRAVLQLVLRQGRSYTDLAGLLKITPEAVRARAHAGMTGLAGNDLAEESRGRVADYLLGQLPAAERAETRAELTGSEPARAWARAASEGLAPIAGDALPELPEPAGEPGRSRRREPEARGPTGPTPTPEAPSPDQPATGTAPLGTVGPGRDPGTGRGEGDPGGGPGTGRREGDPPSSRLGGLALLAGVAILAAAIVLALVIRRSGGSSSTTATPVGTAPTGASTTPATGSGTTPGSTAGSVQVLAQINLNAPNGAAKPIGVVQLKRAGNAAAFQAVLQGLTKPATGFISLWLTGTKTPPIELVAIDRRRVTGRTFTTFAPVPRKLTPYDTMLVTLQPGNPRTPSKAPGRTLLAGSLPGAPQG